MKRLVAPNGSGNVLETISVVCDVSLVRFGDRWVSQLNALQFLQLPHVRLLYCYCCSRFLVYYLALNALAALALAGVHAMLRPHRAEKRRLRGRQFRGGPQRLGRAAATGALDD